MNRDICCEFVCVLSDCAHCRVPPYTGPLQMAVGVTGIGEGGLYCDGKIRRAVQPHNQSYVLEHLPGSKFLL